MEEDGTAILYSTDCPKCKVLRQKLDEAGFRYTENNSVEEMLALGITQVPVLSIDGEMYDFTQAVKLANTYGK